MLRKLLKHKRKVKPLVPAPQSVVIGLNNACNFKCKMCHIWKNKNVIEIPLKKIINIIDQVSLFNNKDLVLQFHGGETLLYKDLTKAISYASKKNIKTAIVTNGFFLDQKKIIELNQAGLHSLNISLDSIEKDVHNELRGIKNSYQKIMQAIEFLGEYNHNMIVGINTIIHSLNITKLVEISRFVKDNQNVSNLYFISLEKPYESDYDNSWYDSSPASYLWPTNKDVINQAFDALKIEKFTNKKITNKSTQLEKYKEYYLNPDNFIKKYGCKFGQIQIHINYSNEVRLCTIRPELEPIGTIDDNLITIWNSEKAKLIRRQMTNCKKNCILILSCGFEDEE